MMCTVSMIGDHYRDRWRDRWPDFIPSVPYPIPMPMQPMVTPSVIQLPPQISRQEFDELKREVREMKDLLKRAKKYDEETGQRDCEVDEKMDLLRKVAKLVGVSLDDVIKPKG